MAARKAKPKKNAKATGVQTWAHAGGAVKGLLALSFVVVVVIAVVWIGKRTGENVADRERYTVRVADIQCEAPPGIERSVFLTEVRRLGELPETIQSVDPQLNQKLAHAFARHPWVAEVTHVRVNADQSIILELRFRTPVLIVRVANETEPRLVDRHAVLLPSTPTGQLTELVTTVLPPTKPSGEVWEDPTVKRAAELAAEYQPRLIEKSEKGWRLTLNSGKVLLVSW